MSKIRILLLRSFICIVALFSCVPALLAQAQNEAQVNGEYTTAILEKITADLSKKEKDFTKQAERFLLNQPNDFKLYDETFVDIKIRLQQAAREDGETEYNLVYSISYNCKNLEGETDDYPLGTYLWSQSNSSRAICNLTKNFVEDAGKEYFLSGKDVTIKLFATTDVIDIAHVPYEGEFGDFRYVPVTFNGEQVRLSVSQEEGIGNNAQLAFTRALSIRDFIENNIPLLRREDNQYQYTLKNYEYEGGQYRRSSIELVVHGAFDEQVKDEMMKMRDDEYVDINIPESQPESNRNTFALIIANHNYPSPLPSVPYADNDGKIFQQYCIKTLGLPERHVRIFNDASRDDIRNDAIEWVKNITLALNGEARIIIYYAGHGLLSSDLKPYIIPTDLELKKIKSLNGKKKIGEEQIILSKSEAKKLLPQCIAIDSICLWFNKIPVQDITFVIDASFDGYQRDGKPFFTTKASTKRMKTLRIRNDILLLASSEFNKTSYAYERQQHGFFTYFMLKELRRTKGDIALKQLFDNIHTSLSYESSLQGKLQQPTYVAGGKLKDVWEGMKLK